ncbi:galactokinase/homoserine kinase family protein (plasmid) [Azospirillum sp. B510]|uniref:GHMP family kinase ATP-binding protein n=1 Tax=Azospirillum sp. (strain B510) TaxID=137722 RepID=UPI0001C4CF4A|nr:kinase [Azospirillum sp. B510]BAI76807.1 galactokinase/homoserine kinase family protein [Azospirillum sp. B510]
MIISRTPFRISFFGGGTDYPAWYKEHGGAVLATSIDKYCYLSCRYLPPFFDQKYRIVYSRIELAKTIGEIEHPSVRCCLQYMGITEGIELVHNADLPARTGLGSSSSFTVGLLHVLNALKGQMSDQRGLAELAIHLEQNVIKENVGSQDQILAAFGGLKHVTFNADNFTVRPVPLPLARKDELQSHLMLFYTGISRMASDVAAHQIRNIPNRQGELMAMRQMVDDALGILSGGSDIEDFGLLLHESWRLKRSLSSHVSTSLIDELYERARVNGALGGKLLGAGGGGFFLVFAPPEAHLRIRQALAGLLHVPFRFEESGAQLIFYSPSEALPVAVPALPQTAGATA